MDPGGLLVLEPHTFEAVKELGQTSPHWYSSTAGLFSPDPHLCLQENFWDAFTSTATERFYVLDVQSGSVARYAATMQAYTNDAYLALLHECGFHDIQFHPSLEGKASDASRMLMVITARK